MNIEYLRKKYKEKDNSIYNGKKVQDLLSILYHENTKFDQFTLREQGEVLGLFRSPYITERSIQPYKFYSGNKKISLSRFLRDPNEDGFLKVINNRRSLREYDPTYKISLNELFHIFYYSYGITNQSKIPDTDYILGLRNVPSAGALYPLEIYTSLFNSQIREGLYHYQDRDNCLELIKEGNHVEELRKIINAEPYVNIKNSSGVIFITGLIERNSIKYGERGYRFILQEVGYVGLLISYMCEYLGLGSCLIGSCIDDEVNEYLGIDGLFETIHTIIIFGKKEQE